MEKIISEFSLAPLEITRPEKIIWRIPDSVRTTQDPFGVLKSKSMRSFLRSVEATLAEQSITWTLQELSRDEFAHWLEYYKAKMTELDYSIIASLEWYDKRVADGKIVEGMFFRQNMELVCTGIFVIEGTQKATFAFKASDRLELSSKENSSIGSVIDFFFIREMMQKGITVISAGKSRNAFGVFNTIGYLDYKFRFGYMPHNSETIPQLQTVPLPENGIVLFFGERAEKLHLFALQPKGTQQHYEVQRFTSAELPFEIIEY